MNEMCAANCGRNGSDRGSAATTVLTLFQGPIAMLLLIGLSPFTGSKTEASSSQPYRNSLTQAPRSSCLRQRFIGRLIMGAEKPRLISTPRHSRSPIAPFPGSDRWLPTPGAVTAKCSQHPVKAVFWRCAAQPFQAK